jgi:hypothetical protein
MYDLINQFAQTVLSTIPPEHVTDYEWFLQNACPSTKRDTVASGDERRPVKPFRVICVFHVRPQR